MKIDFYGQPISGRYTFHPSFFTLHFSPFTLHLSSIEYYENFCRLHLVNCQLIRISIHKTILTSIIFTLYRKVSNLIINCRILDCYIACPQVNTRNLIVFNSLPRQLKVLIPHGYGKKITFCILYVFLIFSKSI